jgi:TRAP-type C4-dicarboxylate transport system permease small subunit
MTADHPSGFSRVVRASDSLLGALSCVAMAGTFIVVVLGVVSREMGWGLAGLDAYAGYLAAATLFLALPMTLRRGDHIRVGMLLDKLPPRGRNALEYWGLWAGLGLALFMAWNMLRLVWVSHGMHDVSPGSDATPLWIPQISLALGSLGFALSFVDALICRMRGQDYFISNGNEISLVE